MANSTAQAPAGFNITLSSTALYWLYAILLIAVVAVSYIAKLVPTDWGVAGIGTIAISFFWVAAHEFEDQHTPSGTPYWVTWVVVTVAAAVEGAIGQFTSDTTLTIVAVIAWIIIVLQSLITSFTEDAGINVPQYAETIVVTIIGASVTFLMWYAQNTTATLGAILATIIAIVTSYLHITTTSTATTVPAATPPAGATG